MVKDMKPAMHLYEAYTKLVSVRVWYQAYTQTCSSGM